MKHTPRLLPYAIAGTAMTVNFTVVWAAHLDGPHAVMVGALCVGIATVGILATELTTPPPQRYAPRPARVVETLRECDTCHAPEGEPCAADCPEGIHYGYTRDRM